MDIPRLPLNLHDATSIAVEAGKILDGYFDPDGIPIVKKGDGTDVTSADKKVLSFMKERVIPHFPEVTFITEEGSSPAEWKPWTCHVDECDGSTYLGWGLPMYLFMLSLCYNGQPALTVVNGPSLHRVWTAEIGQGAKVNGRDIKVSKTKFLYGAHIGVEVSPRQPAHFQSLPGQVQLQGATSHDFLLGLMACLVGEGKLDGLIFTGKSAHDYAGVLLIDKAGGIVTDFNGNPHNFNDSPVKGMVAAGTPELHAQMLEIVQSCRP